MKPDYEKAKVKRQKAKVNRMITAPATAMLRLQKPQLLPFAFCLFTFYILVLAWQFIHQSKISINWTKRYERRQRDWIQNNRPEKIQRGRLAPRRRACRERADPSRADSG